MKVFTVLFIILCSIISCQRIETTTTLDIESHIPNSGVLRVEVPGNFGIIGYYIIDTRFDLCFFYTPESVVEVDCNKLEITSNK